MITIPNKRTWGGGGIGMREIHKYSSLNFDNPSKSVPNHSLLKKTSEMTHNTMHGLIVNEHSSLYGLI